MSAMELFRSRVAQSAQVAASAARQLSSLDDMAQNDDYVQSEGLRVSDKKESTSSASPFSDNPELPSVVEDLSGMFVDAFSTAVRTHNRPRPVNDHLIRQSTPVQLASDQESVSEHKQQRKSATQKPRLMSSVAALYDQNDKEKSLAANNRGVESPTSKSNQSPRSLATIPSSTAHHPRTVNDHIGRQSSPVQVTSDQENVSSEHKQQRKIATQKPKLMSSVAALYDQNDKKKNLTANERGGKSSTSKSNQSPRSIATIPSSTVQKTNVLLVNERHAHILHELDYDSESESSDDDNPREPQNNKSVSDLEMGRLANAALHDKLEQELEESISRQNSLNSPTDGSQQKDVHRFMKMTGDWEIEQEVLLKPLESVPESNATNADRRGNAHDLRTQDTLRGTAGEETNKALRAGMSWVRNIASPQLEALSKKIITKVSEANESKKFVAGCPRRGPMIGQRHPSPTRNNDSETETITVTTSASFLADEDMAELEYIRRRNSSSKLTALLQACLGNRRLVFIAVTLVFVLLAYFYSRHRSVNVVL